MSVRSRVGFGLTGAVAAAGLVWATSHLCRGVPVAPQLSAVPSRLLADGCDSATLAIAGGNGTPPRVTARNAAIDDVTGRGRRWQARIRAGVNPGPVEVRVEFPDTPTATIGLTAVLDARDTHEDGTPDFLRLDEPRDRQAFRRWFTFLAEAQYFQPAEARPPEIADCAALLRYAYREALRAHDAGWAASARLPLVPAYDSIAKYRYPFTPLGAALFRSRSGPFLASELGGDAFLQFADARALWRANTHAVGRGLDRAKPGDLLFFRQDTGSWHGMVYVGASPVHPDGHRYIVYHTGPEGADPGTMRRLTVEELLHFPQPEWRPVRGNANFLGLARWNILRKDTDANAE